MVMEYIETGYKKCNVCECILPIIMFTIQDGKYARFRCIDCDKEYKKKYYSNKDNIKKKNEIDRKYYRNHKKEHHEKQKIWVKNNPEKIKEIRNRFRKTEWGKLQRRKEAMLRYRNLKSIELFINPFPKDVEVDYHHINNILTIPLPRELHRSIKGKRENHRKECDRIILELYGLNIKSLLE
jgi:hypothetical protein